MTESISEFGSHPATATIESDNRHTLTEGRVHQLDLCDVSVDTHSDPDSLKACFYSLNISICPTITHLQLTPWDTHVLIDVLDETLHGDEGSCGAE